MSRRLKEVIKYILVFIVFLISTIIGYYIMVMFMKTPEFDSTVVTDIYFIEELYGFGFFVKVFIRNTFVALIIMSGLFCFSLTTNLALVFNGIWTGCFIALKMSYGNDMLNKILLCILPHGVFEISAFIIAGSIGIEGIRFYFKKYKEWKIKRNKLFVVMGLILIGALVEAYITPLGLKYFL